MLSFTDWNLSTEIIIILCIYLPESDIIKLCDIILNLRQMISRSELLCKQIILRDSHFVFPIIELHNVCQFHLICNQNNPLLIQSHWSKLVPPNCMKLSNLLQTKTFQQFKTYKKIWFDLFISTSTYKMISRIMSFKYWNGQTLINLFDNVNTLSCRSLTKVECMLFTPVHIELIDLDFTLSINSCNKLTYNLVLDICTFKQLLVSRYDFAIWHKFINWNNFIISGSSILSCIINKDWTDQVNHDIDIYAYAIDLKSFMFQVVDSYTQLQPYADNFINIDNIISFELQNLNNSIRLQFIFICSHVTPNRILESFDLDINQVLFNVHSNQVLCTMAFIQCLKSNYIIPYQLIVEDTFYSHKHLQRVLKYIKRGFNQLLLPKRMCLDKFIDKLNVLNQFDNLSYQSNYYNSILPCDYYDVQYHYFSHLSKITKESLNV